MAESFEQILEDNFYLKKNLQLQRHRNEKLQQQLSDQRQLSQELIQKNSALSDNYNKLQRKYQSQTVEHNKDIANLNSQVSELKEYIEQKQQQLEQFQLKMIPNLDKDMIRVQLINQMEGPYQETVQKKDREITRLKQKLTEAERKVSLYQLRIQTKEKECKRQMESSKGFYQAENERLMKQINFALSKKEVKSYDKELFKNQRKELEELRYTLSLHEQNESDFRKQISSLKVQKEKLIIKINSYNQKKALETHLAPQNEEIRALKQQIKRLQQEILRKTDQIEKTQKRMKIFEKQSRSSEQQNKKVLSDYRDKWQNEKQSYKEQLSKIQFELRKVNDKADRLQEELQIAKQKNKAYEKDVQSKQHELERLKLTIGEYQIQLKRLQIEKKHKLTLSKDLQEKQSIQRLSKKTYLDNEKEKENEQTNKKKFKSKNDNEIKQLKKQNEKLKQKLQQANTKIIQLLKEKAQKGTKKQYIPTSDSRDRAFSNIQMPSVPSKKDNCMVLQYRDSSFVPLVPPTIFTKLP